MPKMAWMNLQKGFDRKHHGPELQLRHGLSNVEEKEMSVPDYTVIKEICDSLASINMIIEEDEMVQVYLGGLASKFGAFQTEIDTREKMPLFFNL